MVYLYIFFKILTFFPKVGSGSWSPPQLASMDGTGSTLVQQRKFKYWNCNRISCPIPVTFFWRGVGLGKFLLGRTGGPLSSGSTFWFSQFQLYLKSTVKNSLIMCESTVGDMCWGIFDHSLEQALVDPVTT